jgi:hypothetical protein
MLGLVLPYCQGMSSLFWGIIGSSLLQRMALNSFQLFMSQIQTAPEPLKLPVLKVVFDILMVHGREFLYSENAAIPVSFCCRGSECLLRNLLARTYHRVPPVFAAE